VSRPTLRGLANPLLAAHAPEHALFLHFDQALVHVTTNSPALHRGLATYFRDFLAHPGLGDLGDLGGMPPKADIEVTALEAASPRPSVPFTAKQPGWGKTGIKEEYADLQGGRVVRKRFTGMTFLFGGGLNLAVGPCLANANQVVNFINSRFIEWLVNRGGLLFHAAGVSLRGKSGHAGLALAGFSGMGKSTLALQAMGLGLDFVSNDRITAHRDSGLSMYGVAKMPRVNPGTIVHNQALRAVISPCERERYLAMDPTELWNLEEKHDAFIDECFGPGRFRLKAHMAGLVLLNWRRGGGKLVVREVELATRPDLFPAFMKQMGLFFEPGGFVSESEFRPEAYLKLLRGCPVLEFSGGVDFEAAARMLREFLDKAATRS